MTCYCNIQGISRYDMCILQCICYACNVRTHPNVTHFCLSSSLAIHPAPRGVAAHTAGYFSSYTLNSSALLWTPRGGGGGGGGCRRGCRRRRGRRAHAEPSCAQRKLMSCHVGPMFGPCWAMLGPSWAHLGPIWGLCCAYVDLCWAYVGLSWPMLRLCWAYVGLCWA